MKLTFVLFIAFLLLTGCTKQSTVVTPPTVTQAVLLTLALSAPVACIVTGSIEPSVASWLNGPCVTGMDGILSIIEANGTVAQLQAAINTMRTTAAAIPNTANSITYVNAGLVLAQSILNDYEIVTGQTPTQPSPSLIARTPKKLAWSKSDIRKIEAAKKKLKTR